ncbi:hypothetical protein SCB49_09150 [unidentified eubacterium SCB49]|nr:hypothetical protein SCB49_09150 [unidentified eubacterium SCB49]
MKLKTITIGILVWLTALTLGVAQETDTTVSKLQQAKEQVVKDEKSALKAEVEAINARLEKKEITTEEADALKKEAAEKRALNIENKVAILDNKMALLQRNGALSEEGESIGLKLTIGDDGNEKVFNIGNDQKDVVYDRRTSSGLVFAFGLNNAIGEGQSLDDSPYSIGKSKFAEIGWSWKTRIFKNTNWLRVKYGVSFQFNGLKATDNQYLVDTGGQTDLQVFPLDLDKSKFRMDNLVIPVHFEFGPSKKIEKENYFRYSTYNKLRFGLGGYAGVNLKTIQKLKYEEDGENIKEKIKSSYNTNNFIYGLSGYIGWGGTAVYAKYDLNSIFKDNPGAVHNVSLGLRFDMD